jgi:hypothetical protein
MDFSGWLHRLLESHGICHRIISGEEDNAPEDVTALWEEKQLKGVIPQCRD